MHPASRLHRPSRTILLPGAAEVPEPRVDHMETPSPYTQFGVKGIGEGGAIAPPAAITQCDQRCAAAARCRAHAFAGDAAPYRRSRARRPRRTTDRAGRCMKPARFAYTRPRDLAAALELLARERGAIKIIAGGQSIGPMLNLRLVESRKRRA